MAVVIGIPWLKNFSASENHNNSKVSMSFKLTRRKKKVIGHISDILPKVVHWLIAGWKVHEVIT